MMHDSLRLLWSLEMTRRNKHQLHGILFEAGFFAKIGFRVETRFNRPDLLLLHVIKEKQSTDFSEKTGHKHASDGQARLCL